MQMIEDVGKLGAALAALRAGAASIALVPTMGALHAGHMALLAEARRRARHVVASVFVNPAQFGPGEDLERYPRRLKEDAALLEEAGCALLWAPDAGAMYPSGFAAGVDPGPLGGILEGARRPGHFAGVATVVAKLFNQVSPDIALFGEKDYQQLLVIRRMARDLDFPVEIVAVPTVREPDGLALSSRNAYLSPAEREAARALPEALQEAARAIASGGEAGAALAKARARLAAAGFDPVDYVVLADAGTLAGMRRLDRPARLLAAASIGGTRLIDNLPLAPPKVKRR